MAIDWSLLGPPVDVGAHFQAGLERGRAVRKRAETESALAAYAQSPDDPAALGALMQADPQMGMRARDDQMQRMAMAQKAQAQAAQARQDNIIKGAQIVRQMKPQDQAGWEQALGAAQQLGIDVSSVPRQFDPQYVQQLTAAADAFEPVKSEQATAFQRDYEFLAAKDPKLGEQFLRNRAERDPMIASNGDGTFTIIPRSGGMEAPSDDNPPPPPPGFVLDGGPTPQASGTFRP